MPPKRDLGRMSQQTLTARQRYFIRRRWLLLRKDGFLDEEISESELATISFGNKGVKKARVIRRKLIAYWMDEGYSFEDAQMKIFDDNMRKGKLPSEILDETP